MVQKMVEDGRHEPIGVPSQREKREIEIQQEFLVVLLFRVHASKDSKILATSREISVKTDSRNQKYFSEGKRDKQLPANHVRWVEPRRYLILVRDTSSSASTDCQAPVKCSAFVDLHVKIA